MIVGNDSTWINTAFGAAPDDPWSMLFPISDGLRVGAVLMDNCLVEDCATEYVGIAGSMAVLRDLVRKVGGAETPPPPPFQDL